LRKFGNWSRDKRALSPIFATVLLASIIIIFGSVAYYYSSNLTSTATNNYVSSISNSQQAMAERIGFENVVYTDQSSPATLIVYIINCGSANNVQIDSVFLYDESHNIVGGSPYSGGSISPLSFIDGEPIPNNSLNVGKEGDFTVTLGSGESLLNPVYTIHLITKSGSYFDYDFSP
jgi:FlaG/FlaF family flagellin (archaellin)